jgi:hypothetical protein
MDETKTTLIGNSRATPFAMLRRFAVSKNDHMPAASHAARERCELCSVGLAPEHRHLLEVTAHKIVCACDACALRFQDVVGGRFKLIPRDARSLPGFQIDDAGWEALALPINLAFFFRDTTRGRVAAYYPSPAGATESLLTLEAWQSLVAENRALASMQDDVEALLVNRAGERRLYYLAPLDLCFELTGLLRLHWRGFSGGEEVWREIDRFFVRLEERARPWSVPEVTHA